MPSGNEFPIGLRADQTAGPTPLPRTASRLLHAKRTSMAGAVGLLGLAIAVTLWGFGYKLSRYNLHSDTNSRASFAKLWDKHQDSAKIAETAKVTAQPHPGLEWDAILAFLQETPELQCSTFCPSGECTRIPLSSRSLVPLRSPPSRTLLA